MVANPSCGEDAGPWNPGISSQMPAQLRPLATLLRPENVTTSLAGVAELEQLTGLPLGELVAFHPRRLVLHEVLVRVMADFSVPDGSRIEDLGINFREIVRLLLARYLDPQMATISAVYANRRQELLQSILAAFAEVAKRPTSWGLTEIAACERRAGASDEALRGVSYRCLARVMSALFIVHGRPWGTRELIAQLATDLACNSYGSELIGELIEPTLQRAVMEQHYDLLPSQAEPVVINTKGPSASGKSTLRPLQKRLAGALGVRWSDFALISPDIWRKQLLDYHSLGSAYKYAGALAAEELQLVDQKLDRHMARKQSRGAMSHLLIDRFRFDSFAADSVEAGSNLLTRFGRSVYLFFMITAPELLVERAWKRGLEVGRYKAVDDTLANSVQAYSGMPNVFFTWVRRSDKRIHFEFLDNSVHMGELPRTVAFGSNDTLYVLDVGRMLDIERFGRVNVDAPNAQALYRDPPLLAPEHNLGFLRKCVEEFREVVFADQGSGRVYLRIISKVLTSIDRQALETVLLDPDVHASLKVIAPAALEATSGSTSAPPCYLHESPGNDGFPTVGQWGRASR
jgi:hypothetical protein